MASGWFTVACSDRKKFNHPRTDELAIDTVVRFLQDIGMTNGPSQALSSLLQQVPQALWGAAIGSFLSLIGVMLTLRHSRKLQETQLSHDARQRDRERQMSWRREVYLHAAESLSRLSSLLGSIADLNAPDPEFARVYREDIAKISRIQVIASDATVRAVNAFTGEYAALFLRLSVDRAVLSAQKSEIEALGSELQNCRALRERFLAMRVNLNAGRDPDTALRGVINTEVEVQFKKASYCTQRRQELMERLPHAQQALLKASVDASCKLAPLITPALFAVREELELPLDSARYLQHSDEIQGRLKQAFGESLRRVDQVLAGESPDQKGAAS